MKYDFKETFEILDLILNDLPKKYQFLDVDDLKKNLIAIDKIVDRFKENLKWINKNGLTFYYLYGIFSIFQLQFTL